MKFGRGINGDRGFLYVEVRGEKLWFRHDFESKAVADMVDDQITAEIDKRIQQIRRDAYNAGWSDKAKRAKKKTNFNGCVNGDYVGH